MFNIAVTCGPFQTLDAAAAYAATLHRADGKFISAAIIRSAGALAADRAAELAETKQTLDEVSSERYPGGSVFGSR